MGDFSNGGTTPGVPLNISVESATSYVATGTPVTLSRRSRERNPHLELRGRTGTPLDVGGTLGVPLKWTWERGGTS